MLREIRADNPSAMTLDGTRTYIVGVRHVAIIDPGPASRPHVDAIVEAVTDATNPRAGPVAAAELEPRGAPQGEIGRDAARPGVAFDTAVILLTHTHPDHAAGADALAERLRAEVRGIAHGNLGEGDVIRTDAGDLLALATPGHTPDHASFWLSGRATLFCGDLMMGGLDTALVSPPEGNLRRYLDSLERIRALRPHAIVPAHGPPFDDPAAAIDRYVEHRMARVAQVADVLAEGESLTTRQVADRVYGGDVPDELREVAVGAVVAYLEYLEGRGRIRRARNHWRSGPVG